MPPTLSEELKSTLKDAVPTGKSLNGLYVGAFKRGPVRKEQVFYVEIAETRKLTDQRAYDLWIRYVDYLRSKENEKVVNVGTPQPFAIDIMKEIKS